MVRARQGGAVALAALLLVWPARGSAQTLVLDLKHDSVAVSVRDLLDRRGFIDALESGFPLYMEYHVALRRPQSFRDRTVWDEVWELVVVYDPVRDRYTVRTPPDSIEIVPDRHRLATRLAQVAIVPFDGPDGEFYYEATVEARMLSDDDVDEAFAWLRGEARDSGGVKDPGVVARVARRLLMRVSSLPRVRLFARTTTFKKNVARNR
jgi:hypothetical protein